MIRLPMVEKRLLAVTVPLLDGVDADHCGAADDGGGGGGEELDGPPMGTRAVLFKVLISVRILINAICGCILKSTVELMKKRKKVRYASIEKKYSILVVRVRVMPKPVWCLLLAGSNGEKKMTLISSFNNIV